MLVCSVSLRPPRGAIAAELAEIATADDASTTGQVVFAALIDDPASVLDNVDAYLGEIMLEAASAADAGFIAGGAIVEAASATDVTDGTIPVGPVTRTIFLTSGTTWAVPSDWN